MDREQAIETLRRLAANKDSEAAHVGADAVLCELLIELGYQDVIDEYEKVERWCA